MGASDPKAGDRRHLTEAITKDSNDEENVSDNDKNKVGARLSCRMEDKAAVSACGIKSGKTCGIGEGILFAQKRCRFITKSRPCQSVKGFIETFFPKFLLPRHQREGHGVGVPQSPPNLRHPERLTGLRRVKRGVSTNAPVGMGNHGLGSARPQCRRAPRRPPVPLTIPAAAQARSAN